MNDWKRFLPESLLKKYEFYNYNHAVEILTQAYPGEFQEIIDMLEGFYIDLDDILQGGGSKSLIPKKIDRCLFPQGWAETQLEGDLTIRIKERQPESKNLPGKVIENFLEGHNIDYVKGKLAFDLEWNSKDQTFDRDLYALRTYYETGIIACGILMTRSESMNAVFKELGIMKKYGASTTWMGKLTPRIQSNRHGGCPLLVIGMTPACVRKGKGESHEQGL